VLSSEEAELNAETMEKHKYETYRGVASPESAGAFQNHITNVLKRVLIKFLLLPLKFAALTQLESDILYRASAKIRTSPK
jgi:hypothetical protein